MSRSTQSFDAAILPVVLWIVLLAVPAVAQQPASNTSDQEIYADFYATDKSLRQLHQQKLAEIDERYKTALRAYRDENVKRAQSLTDLNTSDHKALKEKGLKGTQRQTEYVRIQAEDKKRRAEYAEWRDSTARRLQEEHANARREEIERHQAEMERLLADRKAKLAGIRSLNDSIFLTPDGDGSESDAEVNVDELEMLERANDGQAGVGTADDSSNAGSGDDPADSDFGLQMLGRADEIDGSSDTGADDSETASRVSESLPSQSLPPLDGIGNNDLLGDQGQTLPVPAGIEPQQAGTRIAVAFPNTGDVVETGDSGASTQAFELSVTTAVSNTIQRFNFRVLHADGTIVLEKDVCGMGASSSPECGNNPRFSEAVDLSGAGGGTYRLAVQALDSEGDAVSRVVEFQIPLRAVVTADAELAGFDGELIPQRSLMARHPRLAPLPAIHFDHYNSSVTDFPTPDVTDDLTLTRKNRGRSSRNLGLCLNFMVDPAGNLLGFCGDPDGLYGKLGVEFHLALFNNDTLSTLDEMNITEVPGPGNNKCGGKEGKKAPLNLGYFVMDNLGRVIFSDKDNVMKFAGADRAGRKLVEFKTVDISRLEVPGMSASFRLAPKSHQVAQIMPDYDDGYWFTGGGKPEHAAFLGHLNSDDQIDFFYEFSLDHGVREKIENGVAIDATGIYVLTDFALYKFEDTGSGARRVFMHDYKRASSCKPGTIAHSGSGSTPTLLGNDLIAFTDNADGRVNVVVVDRRNRTPVASRLICEVPVFHEGQSANENSLIGYHNSVIVQNWYNAPNKTNGRTRRMQPGIWRVDVAPDRSSCAVKWANDAIGTTATARLSTTTGLIYMPIENWREDKLELAFVSFETGEEVRPRLRLGELDNRVIDKFPEANQILMMPIYALPDGRLVQPVYVGMRVVQGTPRPTVEVR